MRPARIRELKMKKFKLFATILMVALCANFSSCGENSLAGTTWVGYEDDWTMTITFTNDEFGTWAESCAGGSSRSNRFESTLNNSNITIQVQIISSRGFSSIETYRGTVRGRTMTLTDADGYTIVFNRR